MVFSTCSRWSPTGLPAGVHNGTIGQSALHSFIDFHGLWLPDLSTAPATVPSFGSNYKAYCKKFNGFPRIIHAETGKRAKRRKKGRQKEQVAVA